MDFKSLMAAQISKAKKSPGTAASSSSAAAAAAAAGPTAGTSNGSRPASAPKFVRRGDLEAERQKAYVEEQARLEAEREERAAKKRKLEEEEAERAAQHKAKLQKLSEATKARREAEEREEERRRRRRLGLPDLKSDDEGEHEKGNEKGNETEIEDDELRAKLRALNEPVALFGESHAARLSRYYKRVKKSSDSSTAADTVVVWTNGPIPTRLQPVEEKQMLLADDQVERIQSLCKDSKEKDAKDKDGKREREKEELSFLYRQIASYLSLLLSEWSTSLSLRASAVKQSSTGQAAYQSYTSVVRDLTPLYRKLEDQTLDRDLLAPLCEIISHIQKRQYVKANDAYLRLSIGKAAWPIGVTMVGIHERSAREKLHGGDRQAHIMSDEVTRKMLQSLKRCISFAQVRWPPDDMGQLMG